jgi:hypothetical protein
MFTTNPDVCKTLFCYPGRKARSSKHSRRSNAWSRADASVKHAPNGDDGMPIVYEFGRCIVPSRFLQMVKELHQKSKRWEYMQPLYRELFGIMYEDLSPDTAIFSNGSMENIKCGFVMSPKTLQKADKEMEKLQKVHEALRKELLEFQCMKI